METPGKLKACPFCASASVEVLKPPDRAGYVVCMRCGGVAQSIRDWNMREGVPAMQPICALPDLNPCDCRGVCKRAAVSKRG